MRPIPPAGMAACDLAHNAEDQLLLMLRCEIDITQ